MKISVTVVTYNQQETIAQTLDSILCQQGDFELEVVVGEDCSTDNTLAICQEYAERYPNVKLLSGPHNLGIVPNYFRTLKECSGDFLSCIAGDDFYCDDHALEKQSKYLLRHPKVGVMGANGYRYFVRRDELVLGLNNAITAEDSKAKEFYFSPKYQGGVYFTPIGLMIRREMLQYVDLDEIIRLQLPVEDYPMQAIWSQYTKFACLPDPLVTYRVYKESATFISYDHPKYMQYHRGLMKIRRYLRDKYALQLFNYSEEYILEYLFYREYLLYLHQGDYRKAKQLINDSTLHTPKVNKARKMTANRVVFTLFRWYKLRSLKNDLKQRT